MALTYRGRGTVTNQGTTGTGGSIALPSGWAENDICFMFVTRASGTAPSTSPSGWTLLGSANWNWATSHYSWLYYRVMQSGDSAPTISWAAGARTSIAIYGWYAGAAGDYDTSSPIGDYSSAASDTNTDNTLPVNSISPTSAGPMLIFAAVFSSSSITASPYAPTNPGTFTEDSDNAGNTTSRYWQYVDRYSTPSTTLDSGDKTISGSVSPKTSRSIALKPGGIRPSITESVSVAEVPTILVPELKLSVAESIAVSEQGVYGDTIYVGEVVTVSAGETMPAPSVTETVNVGEVPTIFMPELGVSASQTVNVGEVATPSIANHVPSVVENTISVSEVRTVLIPELKVSVTETVNAAEVVTLDLTVPASVTETVNVGETRTILVPELFVSITQGIAVSEVITRDLLVATSVAQTITVTEVVTPLIPELFVSVTDTVNVSEVPAAAREEGVSVAETIPVTETVTLSDVANPSVTETVNAAEVATIQMPFLAVSVTETVNLSETATVEVSAIQSSVTETISVAEVVTLAASIPLSITETVNVADVPDIKPDRLVSITENTINVAEVRTMLVPELKVSVTEPVGVTETVTVQSIARVSVTESVTLSESVTMRDRAAWFLVDEFVANTGVAETGTYKSTWADDGTELVLTEVTGAPGFDYEFWFNGVQASLTRSVSIHGYYDGNPAHAVEVRQWNFTGSTWTDIRGATKDIPSGAVEQTYEFPVFTSADYISGGQLRIQVIHTSNGTPTHRLHIDYLHLSFDEAVTVVDDITVAETVTMLLPELMVSATESVTVGESIDIKPDLLVAITETVNVAEVPTVAKQGVAGANETVSVLEAVTVLGPANPSVTESVSVSETATVFIPALTIVVSEAVTVGEAVTVLVPTINLAATETVTVSEAAAVILPTLNVSVTETVSVTDLPSIGQATRFVSVTESVTVGEVVTLAVPLAVAITESVTVAEIAAVETTPNFSVSETIDVTDAPSLYITELYLGATDDIGVGETVTVELSIYGADLGVLTGSMRVVSRYIGTMRVTSRLSGSSTTEHRMDGKQSERGN